MFKISFARLRKSPHEYLAELKQSELLAILRRLDQYYYVDDIQKVPDGVYDVVRETFQERYPKHAYLKQVGAKSRKEENEVKLPFPMSSLLKMKPDSDMLEKFIANAPTKNYCLSDKLDGISLEIVYEKGLPVKAYTRGDDGITGKDVSRHISAFKIPQKISHKGYMVVRGEAIVSGKRFDKYLSKEAGAGEYKTARNAVGGMINREESLKLFKHIDIVFFRVLGGTLAKKKISQQLKQLKLMDFVVPRFRVVSEISSEFLSEYYEARNIKSKYELDGTVVEYDQPNPITAGRPPYAKAFKENLESDMVKVKIQDVIWQDTRTGLLSPVGVIKPTNIGGVTVERVSLHNWFTVAHGYRQKDAKKGIPKRPIGKGAVVKMVRSGKVIPHVVEVLKAAKKPSVPNVEYFIKGTHAYISNQSDDSNKRAVTHFFSTLKVEGLKAGIVAKLFAAGFDDVITICKMTARDWRKANVGDANAVKIPVEIKRRLKDADVVTLAHASNIFHGVGTTRFEAVFDAYPDITKIAEKPKQRVKIKSMIQSLPKFGDVIATTIANNMIEFATFLKELGIKPKTQEKVAVTGKKLQNHTILMTGVRDASINEFILSQGGKIANSFTKAVTILIVKDDSFYSSKIDVAEERGIPVVTKDKFLTFVKKLK